MGAGRGLGDEITGIKYLMFAFNFLFWLLGCTLLGVGVWIRSDPMFRPYVDSGEVFNNIHVGAYLLIGVGAVVMVIGFVGCCGAVQESQLLLSMFFVCLFIIFAALVASGVWAILRRDTVREALGDVISDHVRHYYLRNSSRRFMDDLQTQGCTGRVFKFIVDKFVIIAGIATGIGIVMIAGMTFSLLLWCSIKDKARAEDEEAML